MTEYLLQPAARASFAAARFTKTDLARGSHLGLGLNCFEPGQHQAVHTHASADKFYLVLSGKARLRVGTDRFTAASGDLVWCPAGVEHGVEEPLEATIMLVGFTIQEDASG